MLIYETIFATRPFEAKLPPTPVLDTNKSIADAKPG